MITLVWNWFLGRVATNPQVLGMVAALGLGVAGLILVASTMTSVTNSIRAVERARAIEAQLAEQLKADAAIAAANRRAEQAAAMARAERTEMDKARTEIAEMEEILRLMKEDPVIFPKELVRELRK